MAEAIIIAVPICKDQLAFCFDWCTHVYFMEVSGKKILRQWEQKVTIEEPWEFARSLVAMNVRLLICGAIPRYFFDWFQLKKVCVIADQRGSVKEILDKLSQQLFFRTQLKGKYHEDESDS